MVHRSAKQMASLNGQAHADKLDQVLVAEPEEEEQPMAAAYSPAHCQERSSLPEVPVLQHDNVRAQLVGMRSLVPSIVAYGLIPRFSQGQNAAQAGS